MENKKLTDKQRLFCHEYLKDLNGTQAAIRAGYSQNSAKEIASQNLTKPELLEYLEKLKEKKFEKVNIDVDDILRDIIDTRKACEKDREHSSRLKANELLGKYKKMWVDRVDNHYPDGHPLDSIDFGVVKIIKKDE